MRTIDRDIRHDQSTFVTRPAWTVRLYAPGHCKQWQVPTVYRLGLNLVSGTLGLVRRPCN